MFPLDVEGRKALAEGRIESLRADARPARLLLRPLRRRTSRLLVAAGERLAQDPCELRRPGPVPR